MGELNGLKLEMDYRGFSEKTKKAYMHHIQDFLANTTKPQLEVDVKEYIASMLKKGYSRVTVNLALSAIKFYFSEVKKQPISVKRPILEKKLPTVLSRKEISLILSNIHNPKHQLLIKVLYGMGLRVSEIVNLKVADVDFDRDLVKVTGKGNKERYVMLPENIKQDLESYIRLTGNPKYVFAGRNGKYTIKSVQKVFQAALRKTGIKKKASCHTLRHTFATHLLEDGVDIRYIQELLGHKQLQTTQVYTHVANKDIKNIKSPLDNMG